MSQPLDHLSASLLPPNATEFERNMARLMPFEALTAQLDNIVNRQLVNPPDEWLIWLLYEKGLLDFLPLFEDKREALENGPLLLQRRGTIWSIEEVWRLCGFEDAQFVKARQPGLHFAEYTIHSGRIPVTFKELCRAIFFSKKVHPVRSRIRRIVHGWDQVPFVLGTSVLGGSDLLGNYSGVVYKASDVCGPNAGSDPIVLSFGSEIGFKMESPVTSKVTAWKKDVIAFRLGYFSHGMPVLGEDFSGGFAPKGVNMSIGLNVSMGLQKNRNDAKWSQASYACADWASMGAGRVEVGLNVEDVEVGTGHMIDADENELIDAEGNTLIYAN